MFTVLSNTRNVKLYLIAAMAIIVITTFVAVPSIAAPKSAVIPVTSNSEWLDYYQRHSELSISIGGVTHTLDYFFRHPELKATANSVEISDYFLRHPELKAK